MLWGQRFPPKLRRQMCRRLVGAPARSSKPKGLAYPSSHRSCRIRWHLRIRNPSHLLQFPAPPLPNEGDSGAHWAEHTIHIAFPGPRPGTVNRHAAPRFLTLLDKVGRCRQRQDITHLPRRSFLVLCYKTPVGRLRRHELVRRLSPFHPVRAPEFLTDGRTVRSLTLTELKGEL